MKVSEAVDVIERASDPRAALAAALVLLQVKEEELAHGVEIAGVDQRSVHKALRSLRRARSEVDDALVLLGCAVGTACKPGEEQVSIRALDLLLAAEVKHPLVPPAAPSPPPSKTQVGPPDRPVVLPPPRPTGFQGGAQ
jgi:hypothetical protein